MLDHKLYWKPQIEKLATNNVGFC